jgi:AraC-like DNA-binding protein
MLKEDTLSDLAYYAGALEAIRMIENLIKDCQLKEEEAQHKMMTSIHYFYSLIAGKIQDKVFSSENTNNRIFLKFKEMILTGNLKIRSMDTYADTLHISTTVLNTICQDFTGVSSKQLLLDLKMTEAKRLLLYSKLNINEISFQLGFEDASYFARIFRKKTQLSPTLFQEKYRK